MKKEALNNMPAPERLAEIESVVKRAQGGDPDAVPRLRELLDEFPEIWAHYGDIAAQAVASWAGLAAGQDLYLLESLLRKAHALKLELAGNAPDPVVALAADRVVSSWIEVNYCCAMEAKGLQGKEALRVLQYRAKRREQAERSHRNALAALTALKKLLPDAKTPAPALPEHAPVNPDLRNRLAGLFAGQTGGPHSLTAVN